jgi:Tol biopolymer transport system component
MKTKLLLVILLSLACHPSAVDAQNSSPQATPARAVKQYTIEQFMDTTRLGGSSFSADERSILFHSNKTGIFNVYTMPVAGGAPKQLTNSTKESTYAVSYFPADARFLYRYDKGGNENEHLYLRELDGTERDLTPGDKTKARFLEWSHDRKSFFFSTNARDARYFDIFEMSIAGLKPALIYKDETGYDFGAISNDEKFIAFEKSGGSTADSDVYLYNTATKEMKHITPHEGDVANSPEAFDPQSKYLYFLSNEGGEFMYVARYDLKEGKREVIEKAPWDVSYTFFSHNGKYRVVARLSRASSVLHRFPADSSSEIGLR